MTVVERHVLISRKWAGEDTQIKIDVTEGGIGVSVPLSQFMGQVLEEYGSPASTITKAQMRRKIDDAVDTVCRSMKQETAKVM